MTNLCPSFIRKNTSTNKHYVKTEDVLCNPQNPVNPDSEPGVRINFQISKLYVLWISHYGRGEWHLPSHDTDKFPYLWNNDIRYSC